MTVQTVISQKSANSSLASRIDTLARSFSAEAAAHDAEDRFAAGNFAKLKQAKLLSAGVPAELGGGGASYRDLAEMLRQLARGCSGTALALAMHTHPLAATVRRFRTDPAAVEPLLRRIATEELMLLSTGGNDWLDGAGTAVAVDGGYRFSGRKRFVSGCEAGNILMTMAVCGDEVLHAGIPMNAEGVKIEQTWRVLGMRASGSHDVVLKDVFVPAASVAIKRTPGQWHPFFHLVSIVAFPLVYAVYRGVAENLRDQVVAQSLRKRDSADAQQQIGMLDTALMAAQAAHDQMVALGESAAPGPDASAKVMTLKRAMTESLLSVADRAMDAAGGSAFYRDNAVERLFRDLQAARYHPLTALPQQRLAGRVALGLTPDGKAA